MFRRASWRYLQPPTHRHSNLKHSVTELLTITKALRQLTVSPYLTIYGNSQYNNFPKVYEQVDFFLICTCFLDGCGFYNSKKKAIRLFPIISYPFSPERLYGIIKTTDTLKARRL